MSAKQALYDRPPSFLAGSLMKKSPLKRSGPLRRKKEVKGVNRKRAKKRLEAAFGSKADFIRRQWCVVELHGTSPERFCPDQWPMQFEAAHVKSRGAGGTSKHLIPLCTAHHHEQHAVGIQTFAAKYGLDLEALAAEYELRFRSLTKDEEL
jgi:hypothetical protein